MAEENHILPINAMQHLAASGELFTGGRDGAVKVWQPVDKVEPEVPLEVEDPFVQDLDERLLKLETLISLNALRHRLDWARLHERASTNYNLHFDWINDIKLVNSNRHLVTASADLLLKIIDTQSPAGDIHKFQNVHTDYVKKILAVGTQQLVVSGGLDGQIVIWDLKTLKPILRFYNLPGLQNLPASVYGLSNNHSNLIASGGPSSTINIFDRRITTDGGQNLVRRLVGHQDNVRCLLMNLTQILLGLLDLTVKLWDLRNFKVLRNFEMHDDAVWSLTTPLALDPAGYNDGSFDTFYSGDKAGNIIKTDVLHLGSTEFAFHAADLAFIDEKLGLCVLVAKADSPVVSLCAAGDTTLYALTYASLNLYHVPDTRQMAQYQYLRACVDHLAALELQPDVSPGPATPTDKTDLDLDFYDIVSHLLMDTNNVDVQLALSHAISSVHGEEAHGDGQVYTLMFLSPSGGPLLEFVNAYKEHAQQPQQSGPVNETPVEILLNPVAPLLVLLISYNCHPQQLLPVLPKLIIAKKMLNNKRWIVALYLNGDIKLWDIFVCRVIREWPYGASTLTPDQQKDRLAALDDIFHDYHSMDTFSNWCEVEIKSGKLLVLLLETLFANVEIYYDELVQHYPYMALEKNETALASKPTVSQDEQYPLSQILLNSVFHRYALYELRQDEKSREDLRSRARLASVSENDFNSSRRPKPRSAANSLSSNFSDSELEPDETPEDLILRLLAQNRAKYAQHYVSSRKLAPLQLSVCSNDPAVQEKENRPFRPFIPFHRLPKHLLIIIFESSPDLGNNRDVCSFHLSELEHLDTCLVRQIRANVPKWIGLPILYDKFPQRDAPKIAFQLHEFDYAQLPLDKKIGGRAGKKIKKLPPLDSSLKLASQNMLRLNKVVFYLTEKFEFKTSEMKEKRKPTDWLELECRGQVLDPSLTLQTIKTKIWKSSSDIELRYRRKFD